MSVREWINVPNTIVAIVSFVAGVFIAHVRGRIRVLEYVVYHDRIGISANDQVFGDVRVTWNSNNLKNLFLSRIELTNDTGLDLTDVDFKVYAGETILLNQRTELCGTPYVLDFTPDYAQKMNVAPNTQATPDQLRLWHSVREYRIPVLNRGQKISIQYLTTILKEPASPAIFAAALHKGIRFQERRNVARLFGIDARAVGLVGLLITLIAVAGFSLLIETLWVAAALSAVVALTAHLLAATVIRAVNRLSQVFFG